jgi:DNA invertase Pin-like site-specific DNA recombinase
MARKSRKVLMTAQIVPEPAIMSAEPKIATAAYVRLSVDKEYKRDSIQNQVSLIHDYIQEHPEYELIDTYVDNGYSGTDFDRPDFKRLMDDVRTGKIQCIVVKDLSRFGRDFLETGYYIETLLPRLNVRLIAINDEFDSSREEDVNSIAVPIKNLVNEMYAKDFSRKVTAYNDLHRERGDVKLLRSVYGYRRDTKNNIYVVNPDTAPTVQMIFRWYLLGHTTGEIAERLNLMRVMTPFRYKMTVEKKETVDASDAWNSGRVRDILRNTIYIGDLTWGRRRKTLFRNVPEHKTPKEEWVVYHNMHEPIISKEDFYMAQSMIDQAAQKLKRKSQGYYEYEVENFFQGLVYCAKCGQTMRFMKYCYQDRDGAYYFCRCKQSDGEQLKVHLDFLKMVVTDQIQLLIREMCDRKALLQKSKAEMERAGKLSSFQRKIQRLQFRLEHTEESLAKLYENLVEGILTKEDYRDMKQHYLKEKEETRQKLHEAEQEKRTADMRLEKFMELEANLEQHLGETALNEQLVRKLVERIEISEKHGIEIRFTCEDVLGQVSELTEEETA